MHGTIQSCSTTGDRRLDCCRRSSPARCRHAGEAGPTFSVTNLITNNPADNPGQITDPNLVNPWGVSFGPTTPMWVSQEGPGVTSLYSIGQGDKVTIVTSPSFSRADPGGRSDRAGLQYGCRLGPSRATPSSSSRWVGPSRAGTPRSATRLRILVAGSSANSYDGSTLVTVNNNTYLLAANTMTGHIDVISGGPNQPPLGSFTDPKLPAGFVPYNIQVLNGVVYVTYFNSATKDGGIVDAFSTSGTFLSRIGTGGSLDQPWGLAIAPASFGHLAGDLLVGNKASGEISIFNLANDTALGTLNGTDGKPIVLPDLWALTTGNDNGAGSSQEIYFTEGADGYKNGVLGVIQIAAVPEPSTAALGMIASGLVATGMLWRKYRRGHTKAPK